MEIILNLKVIISATNAETICKDNLSTHNAKVSGAFERRLE